MLELTHRGLYVQSKIDGIESDIIVQNGMRYSHKSQIGCKVEITSPMRSAIYCYNFLQKIYYKIYLFLILFFCSVCVEYIKVQHLDRIFILPAHVLLSFCIE